MKVHEHEILITGADGMLGKAVRKLLPDAIIVRGCKYCDLTDKNSVIDLFRRHRPKYVLHLAAHVGGVKANSDKPASFFYDNMMMNLNVLHEAKQVGAKQVISLMSTCVFPSVVDYPLTENQLHNGPPHDSNFGYAYAKRSLDVYSRALRKQHGCNFVTVIPNNLYGPHDNFDLNDSHVVPALIRKFYEAYNKKFVTLWGDGSPLREFTYVDDMAKILVSFIGTYDDSEPINIGTTKETSIKEIAEKIAKLFDFNGEVVWDASKPNGQIKKPSSSKKYDMIKKKGFQFTQLDEGLRETCRWFRDDYPFVRGVAGTDVDPYLQTR